MSFESFVGLAILVKLLSNSCTIIININNKPIMYHMMTFICHYHTTNCDCWQQLMFVGVFNHLIKLRLRVCRGWISPELESHNYQNVLPLSSSSPFRPCWQYFCCLQRLASPLHTRVLQRHEPEEDALSGQFWLADCFGLRLSYPVHRDKGVNCDTRSAPDLLPMPTSNFVRARLHTNSYTQCF